MILERSECFLVGFIQPWEGIFIPAFLGKLSMPISIWGVDAIIWFAHKESTSAQTIHYILIGRQRSIALDKELAIQPRLAAYTFHHINRELFKSTLARVNIPSLPKMEDCIIIWLPMAFTTSLVTFKYDAFMMLSNAIATLSPYHTHRRSGKVFNYSPERKHTLLIASLASLNKEMLKRLHMLVSLALALRKARASFSVPSIPLFCISSICGGWALPKWYSQLRL